MWSIEYLRRKLFKNNNASSNKIMNTIILPSVQFHGQNTLKYGRAIMWSVAVNAKQFLLKYAKEKNQ